ncbi:hypothetical protein SAMN05421872_112175 [Nocardioides lianchengensis]|uniref:Lsr2 protein n=1 Tax=Nocardioides lianchengensis TaxID=1045774 RepID=A0A1G6YXA9_9ACTN|nr:hypothetical protein [Nocardioides lianchengensis]SDD94275.1 hypothetical protein SAMN05421872_112175 [Nocardioides lianchengensis]
MATEPTQKRDGQPPTDAPATFRSLASTCTASEVRAWALAHDMAVARTGGLPRYVYDLYLAAHDRGPRSAAGMRQGEGLDQGCD